MNEFSCHISAGLVWPKHVASLVFQILALALDNYSAGRFLFRFYSCDDANSIDMQNFQAYIPL